MGCRQKWGDQIVLEEDLSAYLQNSLGQARFLGQLL